MNSISILYSLKVYSEKVILRRIFGLIVYTPKIVNSSILMAFYFAIFYPPCPPRPRYAGIYFPAIAGLPVFVTSLLCANHLYQVTASLGAKAPRFASPYCKAPLRSAAPSLQTARNPIKILCHNEISKLQQAVAGTKPRVTKILCGGASV